MVSDDAFVKIMWTTKCSNYSLPIGLHNSMLQREHSFQMVFSLRLLILSFYRSLPSRLGLLSPLVNRFFPITTTSLGSSAELVSEYSSFTHRLCMSCLEALSTYHLYIG